jgi:chromosome segregation ATPase
VSSNRNKNLDLPEESESSDELENQVNHIRSQGEEDPLTTSQIDILKRYIELKEAEVRDLKQQQQQYQDHTQKSGVKLDSYIKQNRSLLTQVDETQRNLARLNAEMEEEHREHQEQLTLLKNDYEERLKQAGATQDQLKGLIRQKEEFKEKVREDLKRIKLKERELENKYELLRSDTQTLLDAKDRQILELKKKTDALDLELEQLDDKLRESANLLNEVSVKKRRLIETFKIALALLEDIDRETLGSEAISERKAG